MKSILLMMLAIIFMIGSPALGFEVLFFGGLEAPYLPEADTYPLLVDMGEHSLTSEEWAELAEDIGERVVLPAMDDFEEHASVLAQWREEGRVAAAIADEAYPPYLTFTHNYHNVALWNVPLDFDISSLGEEIVLMQEEIPDTIVVVGTEDNLPFLREVFAFAEERTIFIEREEITANYSRVEKVEEKPVFLFFWSSRCPSCRRIKNEIAPEVWERYEHQVKVEYFDYIFAENYQMMVELEEYWNVQDPASVTVFSSAGYVSSEDESVFNEKLEELVIKTLELTEEERVTFSPGFMGRVEELLFDRFEGMTLMVVIGAGLLDGLNPCAFATIVFMVNLLMVMGHTKRRIIEIGLTYSVAVYVTYFLLGILFFQVWQYLEGFHIVSRIIYGVMAGLLIVFAVLSFKDAAQYKREKKDTGMTMGLPKGVRIKINQYLKKAFTERKMVIAALMAGVVISFLEAGCTGQIYFPIIMLIHSETTYQWRAIYYLLIYNLFFIVPLLVVFAGVFFGSQSKSLVSFGKKNVFFSKIALGVLFVVLSILLLEGALY